MEAIADICRFGFSRLRKATTEWVLKEEVTKFATLMHDGIAAVYSSNGRNELF